MINRVHEWVEKAIRDLGLDLRLMALVEQALVDRRNPRR